MSPTFLHVDPISGVITNQTTKKLIEKTTFPPTIKVGNLLECTRLVHKESGVQMLMRNLVLYNFYSCQASLLLFIRFFLWDALSVWFHIFFFVLVKAGQAEPVVKFLARGTIIRLYFALKIITFD